MQNHTRSQSVPDRLSEMNDYLVKIDRLKRDQRPAVEKQTFRLLREDFVTFWKSGQRNRAISIHHLMEELALIFQSDNPSMEQLSARAKPLLIERVALHLDRILVEV